MSSLKAFKDILPWTKETAEMVCIYLLTWYNTMHVLRMDNQPHNHDNHDYDT